MNQSIHIRQDVKEQIIFPETLHAALNFIPLIPCLSFFSHIINPVVPWLPSFDIQQTGENIFVSNSLGPQVARDRRELNPTFAFPRLRHVESEYSSWNELISLHWVILSLPYELLNRVSVWQATEEECCFFEWVVVILRNFSEVLVQTFIQELSVSSEAIHFALNCIYVHFFWGRLT